MYRKSPFPPILFFFFVFYQLNFVRNIDIEVEEVPQLVNHSRLVLDDGLFQLSLILFRGLISDSQYESSSERNKFIYLFYSFIYVCINTHTYECYYFS